MAGGEEWWKEGVIGVEVVWYKRRRSGSVRRGEVEKGWVCIKRVKR